MTPGQNELLSKFWVQLLKYAQNSSTMQAKGAYSFNLLTKNVALDAFDANSILIVHEADHTPVTFTLQDHQLIKFQNPKGDHAITSMCFKPKQLAHLYPSEDMQCGLMRCRETALVIPAAKWMLCNEVLQQLIEAVNFKKHIEFDPFNL
jgi:hypothetical protein